MMDGTFVDSMAKQVARPESIDNQDGEPARIFVPPGWSEKPPEFAEADAIQVSTLTGFIDYAKKAGVADTLVHVVDPTEVRLHGPLENEATDFRRQTYCVASTKGIAGAGAFQFSTFLDAEIFFINLQSQFVNGGHREELLKLIASIRENVVKTHTDDGVAQSVVASKGIMLVTEQRVPNPVTLAPYRTFRELPQPASLFVLRLQPGQGDKPKLALFEADGGAWKLMAIQNIATFLREKLPDALIVA